LFASLLLSFYVELQHFGYSSLLFCVEFFSNRSRASLLQIGVCHLAVRRNVCRVEFTAQVLFGELLKDIAAMARAEEQWCRWMQTTCG